VDCLDDHGIAGVALAAAALPKKVNQAIDVAALLVVEGTCFVNQTIEAFAVTCVGCG